MQKLLAAALGLASAICVLPFAACNQDGGQGTTVTEDKWKTAFSYFTVEWNEETYYPILSDNPRENFSCKMNLSYFDGTDSQASELIVSSDYDKWVSGIEFVNNGANEPAAYYGWEDGDVYYNIGGGWRVDGETGERINYYTKSTISEEQFKMGFDSVIYSYAGGDHIRALNLADKFEKFTYSEEKEEYVATIRYESYATDATVTVKFNDGMIEYMAVDISGTQYGDYVYAYTYTYGISVTVPEYYLNLQLGENIIN